ncbi:MULTISPECIES: response regulator [unclassified Brevundimonas]|uniref:response regulator n=1 Tax=unclassified Brevundimonas TaxID=2622653 RepID=UPI00249D92A9|nr:MULTISPECIES: response regulator [unclassified Brevundimonas]
MKPILLNRVTYANDQTFPAMTARILIIEDEALVAMELRFVLEDLGHDVIGVAATAKAARDIARENDVDLALVDIHLSDGATGIDLGRELGQDMGVSVLFMTANPGMVRNGVAGTIGVLSKPTDERAVQTGVDYALRRRQGQPTDYAPPGLQLFG